MCPHSGDRHLRADPSGRLTPPVRPIVVGVEVDDPFGHSTGGQLATSMVANLLGRQFGVIKEILLRVPEADLDDILIAHTPSSTLYEHLLSLGKEVSGGKIAVRNWSGHQKPDVVVQIGPDLDPRSYGCPAIAVSASDWEVTATTHGPIPVAKQTGDLPFGPLLAACMASGYAFMVAMGRPLELDVIFRLWENGPSATDLRDLRLPDFYLFGAGAVGAAFMYSLASILEIQGRAVVVDPQTQSKTDRNRLVSGSYSTVGETKVNLIETMMARSDVQVIPHVGRWPDDYVTDTSRRAPDDLRRMEDEYRYEWVISCVDRNRDRRGIANYTPRHVFSGSSDGLVAQAAYYAMHGDCECLGCNHPVVDSSDIAELAESLRVMRSDERSEWFDQHGATHDSRAAIEEYLNDPNCGGLGEAELARLGREGEVDFSVGFVSMAAGVLLATSFIKAAILGVENMVASGSETRMIFWSNEIVSSNARRRSDCPICTNSEIVGAWKRLWSDGAS